MTDWCIAFIKPASHQLVKDNALHRLGVEVYIPQIRWAREGNGHRVELVEVKPVFPGYMFVPMVSEWYKMDTVPDFFGFLMRINEIVVLPQTLIDEIQLNVELGTYEEYGQTIKRYAEGAIVKVEVGPFAGEIGVISKMPSKKNPKVLIRGTTLTIPRKNLLLV